MEPAEPALERPMASKLEVSEPSTDVDGLVPDLESRRRGSSQGIRPAEVVVLADPRVSVELDTLDWAELFLERLEDAEMDERAE